MNEEIKELIFAPFDFNGKRYLAEALVKNFGEKEPEFDTISVYLNGVTQNQSSELAALAKDTLTKKYKNRNKGQPRKWPKTTVRTIRIPDENWNRIPGEKSDFINRAIVNELHEQGF